MSSTTGRSAARRSRHLQRSEAEQRHLAQCEVEQRRVERRRRLLVRGGIALGALLAATGLVLLIVGRPGTTLPPSAVTATPVANGYGATALPPWPAPTDIRPGWPRPGRRSAT